MASNETPSRIRVGDRVRFMSDTGRRYGFVTELLPAPGTGSEACAYVRFGDGPDAIFPDSPTWTLDISDLTRVDRNGDPIPGDDAELAAALALIARNLRDDASALAGSSGIPKTAEDAGRADGYRGAAERIESLLDTFGRLAERPAFVAGQRSTHVVRFDELAIGDSIVWSGARADEATVVDSAYTGPAGLTGGVEIRFESADGSRSHRCDLTWAPGTGVHVYDR